METPLISVIVPVFNRETWLPTLFESLTAQTFRPFEVVLVDNGSTDNSLSLCKAFRHTWDSPLLSVKVLLHPDGGANGARNAGFEASCGNYVLFFDSDDKLLSDSLSRLAAQLDGPDAPDMLVFPFLLVFPDGHREVRPHRFSADPAAQLVDTVAATHNMCLKRSLVGKAGRWDETLLRWQDLEFGFRLLLQAEAVAWINGKPFHEVSMHPSSISGPSYSADLEQLERALDTIQASIHPVEESRRRNHLHRACCFKRSVLAGNLWQEGQRTLSRRQLALALDQLPNGKSSFFALVIRFNYLYMKLKGRGFWRLADRLS